ncbi:hypothetical protein PRUPE_3G167700 [Prunus persica]|uniref:Leucine-rich repeat-containing N-terminal plant-type domain-containing protein n=1 Tax=Prunus persica TaxID=3760 RepID=A0A251Q198_PRUPE|nr:hypothetical protein PRUPE_3G167700 [Prunus persica]
MHLSLYKNQFSREIPSTIGNCSKLQEFGVLLLGLGNCSTLTRFSAVSSNLEGSIPSSFGHLKYLTTLQLQRNYLTGEISISIWKLRSLKQILVFNNSLTRELIIGELPVVVIKLKQLKFIRLFNNLFFGVIPQSLGINISLSLKLILGSNRFQCTISSDVGTCSSLSRLSLYQNNLIGVFPQFAKNPTLSYMDIAARPHHEIIGEIPSSLGNCNNLTSINLCWNKLTGVLPHKLRNLAELHSLNISKKTICDNIFTGGIPPFFLEFGKLLELKLGGNFSETKTLKALGYMSSLIKVDVSDNNFTGAVPETLMKLLNSSPLSFLGNPYICVSYLSSCGSTCARNNTLGSSLLVVSMLYGLVYVFLLCKKTKQEFEVVTQEGPPPDWQGPFGGEFLARVQRAWSGARVYGKISERQGFDRF